jgi:hypothetical protein
MEEGTRLHARFNRTHVIAIFFNEAE